ncbi:MAG: Hsp20/alpha crystallin family protein [Desulfobacteraceae bacterium]|nr:MAG: Hsp20/alpha crystallin family protein [Desulfobacteraceae bacterium]
MDIKKIVPFDWFKKEERAGEKGLPILHRRGRDTGFSGYHPVSQLHQEIDRMFDNMYRSFGWPSFSFEEPFLPRMTAALEPTLDVSATENEYDITVEVPGVEEKDIQLELVHDTLNIKGEKKQEREEKDKDYYRVERSYGSFHRMLSLPEDADQDNINATFKNGIMKITIPRKALPKTETKKIEIKAA